MIRPIPPLPDKPKDDTAAHLQYARQLRMRKRFRERGQIIGKCVRGAKKGERIDLVQVCAHPRLSLSRDSAGCQLHGLHQPERLVKAPHLVSRDTSFAPPRTGGVVSAEPTVSVDLTRPILI